MVVSFSTEEGVGEGSGPDDTPTSSVDDIVGTALGSGGVSEIDDIVYHKLNLSIPRRWKWLDSTCEKNVPVAICGKPNR